MSLEHADFFIRREFWTETGLWLCTDAGTRTICAIKIRFVRTIPLTERRSKVRVARGERGIWQRRFWEHTIRDERDYVRNFDYIHYKELAQARYKAIKR